MCLRLIVQERVTGHREAERGGMAHSKELPDPAVEPGPPAVKSVASNMGWMRYLLS